MTISSTTRIAGPFVGNGTASVFPFTFKVFAAADLDVIRLNSSTGVETTLVLNSDYTVTLNGNQNTNPGGSVTLSAGALATGLTLTITSDIANLQPTDLTNQGGFYPEVITDSFDRATIQIQQMADDLTRSIKTPISDGLSLNMELPTASQRANSFLAFDASGEPTVVTAGASGAPATITRQTFSGTGSQTAFTLASDPGALGNSAQVYIGGVYQQRSTYTISGTTLTFSQAPVAGTDNIEFVNFLTSNIGATSADLVTYTPTGSGAVARSAASKFGEVVSVKDFGAKGDGITDDTAAIQAAIDAVSIVGGPELFFPAGDYLCQSGLLLRNNSRLCGDNTAPQIDRGAFPKSNTRLLFPSLAAGFKALEVEATVGTYTVLVAIRNLSISGTMADAAVSATSIGIDMSAGVGNVLTENVWIDRFGIGMKIDYAISHNHNRLRIQHCKTECLRLGPTINTTTWFTNCTFRESPWGVVIESGLGIHFINPYIESLTTGGVQINNGCYATFTNTYSENVLGTIFRVFVDAGVVPADRGVVCITGGEIAGGNASLTPVGIDIGATGRVNIYGATLMRCVDAIRCDAATTLQNSVGVFGCEFIQVTNPFTTSDAATYGFINTPRVNQTGAPTCKAAQFSINRATPSGSMYVAKCDATTITGLFGLEADGATHTPTLASTATSGNAALSFKTAIAASTAERARINTSGYFKASPSASYSVPNFASGSTANTHQFESSTNSVYEPTELVTNTNSGASATVLATTKPDSTNGWHIICFDHSTAAAKFRVAANGDVTNTTGSYAAISDATLKDNIVDAASQWNDILAIRLRNFTMRDDPSAYKQLGVIAQELETTCPGLVQSIACSDDGDTVRSVKYSILFLKAVGALQEAMRRIEALESRSSP